MNRLDVLMSTGDMVFDFDPRKVLIAFLLGLQYHDALVAMQRKNPDKLGERIKADELDAAFTHWHNAIADVLGEMP